jgi:hypothetical protein
MSLAAAATDASTICAQNPLQAPATNPRSQPAHAAASGPLTVVASPPPLLLLLLLGPAARTLAGPGSRELVMPVVATHTLVFVVCASLAPSLSYSLLLPLLLLLALTLLAPPVVLKLGMLLAAGASRIAPVLRNVLPSLPLLLLLLLAAPTAPVLPLLPPAAAVLLLAAVRCAVLGPRPSAPAKVPLLEGV